MSKCSIQQKIFDKERNQLEVDIKTSASNLSDLIHVIKSNYLKRINFNSPKYIKKEDIFYIFSQINEEYSESLDPNEKLILENIKVVQNNFDSLIAQQFETVVQGARINLDLSSSFINIFGSTLNNETKQFLENKLKMLAIWDRDNGKVIGSVQDLNRSILTYKNSLYKILQNYISNGEGEKLYNIMSRTTDISNYENVLKTSYKQLILELGTRSDLKILSSEDNLYKVALSLYVLNNFDSILEHLAGDIIYTKPSRQNNIDLDMDKYYFNPQVFPTQDYEGNLKSKGSENYTNNIFQSFISNIPNNKGGYVSAGDLKIIFNHIHNKAQKGIPIGMNTQGNSWDKFLLSKANSFDKWDMLINYLEEDEELQLSVGNGVVFNLIIALRSFKDNYMKAYNNAQDGNQKTYLNNYLNMGAAFIQEIESNNPVSAVLITPEGIEYQQLDQMTRSKQYVYDRIKETMIHNMITGNINYYSASFFYDDVNTPGTSKNIFDDSFINYMSQAWGINFTQDVIDVFSQDEFKLYNLFEFIRKTSQFVRNFKPGKISKYLLEAEIRRQVDEFIDSAKYDSDTIGFTSALVLFDDNTNKKLISQNKDTLPASTIQNIAQSFVQNRDSFSKVAGKNSDNIFIKYPGLYTRGNKKEEKYSQHVSYRYDVKFDENSNAVVKAVDLNSDETMHVAFNFEFLHNILTNKIFSNQTTCYSDKVTIPLVNVNMYGNVNGKSYIKSSNKELYQIYKNQYKSYFKKLEERLIETYSVLFQTRFTNLNDAINKLNTYDSNSLRELVKNTNLLLTNNNQPELQLTDNVHYSINDDGKVFFNPELFAMIQIANNNDLMDEWQKTQFLSFEKDFKNIKIAPVLKKLNLDDYKEDLKDLFEISDDNEWQTLKSELQNPQITNWGQLSKSNIISRKYFLLQSISTEAEIQITSKYPFVYGSYNNFDILDSEGKINLDQFFKYHSKSYARGSKRNSLHTASSVKFGQGLPQGVPSVMNVAVVEDINIEFKTYLGQKVNQDVHDGGGHTNGIFSIWENNSFAGKTLSGTKKEIGFTLTYEGITQTKYADYVLSNSKLRNSKGSISNLREVFKSMNNVPFNQGIDFSSILPTKSFYKEVGGIKYQVTGITGPDVNGQYSINLKTSDGSEFSQKYTIKTVYDLWNALGGEWVWEIDQYGEKPSEASMEYVAYIISELQPDLKSKVIAKIVPESATKSAIINLNPSLDKLEKDENGILILQSYKANTNMWGIQNDSSHLADDSEISGPTQVIQALSFFGTNIKLASDVYKTMAAVTMESLNKLNSQFTNDDDKFNFHYQLTQDLLVSLQAAKDVSSAPELAVKTLKALEEWKQSDPETRGTIPCLPYDSPEIFPKISSDLMTALNKTSIKTKFSGIAIVLNPSHGIITLYEDIDGKIHTTQDLLRKSKSYFTNEVITDTSNWTPEVYIDKYLKSGKFTKLNPDIMDIQIGDHIVIKEENTTKSDLIDSPSKLRDLHTKVLNGAQILEIQLYKGRDLRPSLISYNRNGQKFNFWHHEAVKLLEEDQINKIVNNDHKLYFRAVLDALSKGRDYVSYEDWKNGISIEIDSLNYKPGEQMLPKVNKTAHNLGNRTLLEIEESGAAQFEADIRQKLQPSNFVTSRYGDNNNYVQIVKSDSEIIITNNNNLLGLKDPEVITYNNEQWIVNSKGELLCKQPLNRLTKYLETYSNNGKKQYIIVNEDMSSDNMNEVISGINDINSLFYSESDVNRGLLSYVNHHNKILKYGTKITSNTLNFNDWNTLANELFTSFQLSNKTTSLRIPSQSLQSFMAMQTVAFMDDDVNDGYVNIYEILFQGSDFDIDKAYTVMYDLDNVGRVESFSNLFDYSSEDALYKSTYMLPLPDKSLIINNNNQGEDFVNFLIQNGFGNKINLFDGKIDPIYSIDNGIKVVNWNQEEIINLLQIMKKSGKTFYYDDINKNSTLIEELNKHNRRSSTKGFRNKIVSSIFKVSNDIVNLEHSSQLMNSKEVRAVADNIRSEDGDIYYMLNPMSRFILQEKNSVGKTNVGIFANGTKSNSVLQQYFNEKFQQVRDNSNYQLSERYKINIDLSFNIPGKSEKIEKQITRLGNTIINIDILKQLNPGQTEEYYQEELKRISLEPEVADKLSMLISLATDNAKELLLDRINAIPELSNMHIALFTLGFSVQEVLEISMNLFDPLVKALRVNRFKEKKNKESIRTLINRIYQDDVNLPSLLKIQDVAQEMTLIAKVLKINQGVPSKYTEVMDFLQKLTQSKYELEDTKTLDEIVDEELETGGYRFKEKPLDVYSFINDENYRNALINYMDQFKVAVNIFDVIANTPHFFAMLKAVVDRTNKLEQISGKAKFLSDNNLSKDQFITMISSQQDFDVENSDLESDINSFTPSDNRKNQLIIMDHKIIGDYLSKLSKYTFNLGTLNKQLGVNLSSEYSQYSQFDLSTESGVELFILAMDSVIIPQLKNGNLKSNPFIQHLILKSNYQLGTTNYDIDVDFFGTKTRQLENTKREIENGFKNIANKNSGIKNIEGQDIKLGELFYLYNLICYKSKLGGLTKILKNVDELLKTNLKSKLDDEYRLLGLNPKTGWGRLTEFVSAISEKSKTIKVGNGAELDLNNKYIYTFNKPQFVNISVDMFLSNIISQYNLDRDTLTIECI